jgi:hypothetical protein
VSAAFPAGLWPSEPAIARVLDATGRQFVSADLDIAALRADLCQCRDAVFGKQIDTAGYRRGYKKAAAKTIKAARTLRALLKSSGNGFFDWQLRAALAPGGDHANAIALLETIEREAEKVASQGIDVVLDAPGGPKDYLVRLLEPIYERHFKRPPGRSHDSSGPFPRFVEAISGEMGRSIRVSRYTVHKSLTTQRRDVGKT